MGKIFNDLVYSNYVPTYAGLPVAEADETAGVLEGKYYANKDASDKLEIAMANLDVHAKDAWIKQEAMQKLKTNMATIVTNGDWENGSMLVRNEAKDFATNQGVMNALKSAKNKSAIDAELTEATKKKEGEGMILEEDKQFVMNEGENAYKGVYQDANGVWKGHFGAETPPAYINIGKRTDDFLTGMQADTYLGRMTDEQGNSRTIVKKDGKFVWAMQEMSKEGDYIWSATTKEVPYEQAYQAARAYIMQSGDIQKRIEFDGRKNKVSLEGWAKETGQTEDEARTALIDDLTKLAGYPEADMKKMTNEELKRLHNKETIVYNAISGPVAKHSYTEEKMQVWGETLMVKRMRQVAANASAGGGNGVNTIANNRILHEHYTQDYNLNNPQGIASINQRRIAATKELAVHRATWDAQKASIDKQAAELKAKGMSPSDIQIKLDNEYAVLQRIQNNMDKYSTEIKDADLWEKHALEKVKLQHPNLDVDAAVTAKEKLLKTGGSYGLWGKASGEQVTKADAFDKRLSNFLTADGRLNLDDYELSTLYSSNPKDWDKVLKGYVASGNRASSMTYLANAKTDIIAELKRKNLYTDEVRDNIETEFAGIRTEMNDTDIELGYGALTAFNNSTDGQLAKKVDDQLKELSKNTNYKYTYVDLSSAPDGSTPQITKFEDVTARSDFTGNMTRQLRNNPKSYSIVGINGKVTPFNDNAPQYDPMSTIVTGITQQYVPGIGYCMIAKEWDRDKKTGDILPNTAPREIMLQPQAETARTGMLDAARLELQTGTFRNEAGKIGGKTWFDVEDSGTLAKILEHTAVDAQLAEFTRFPIEKPDPRKKETIKELNRTIYHGQYEIGITRKVNLVGDVTWDAHFKDRLNGDERFELAYQNETDLQLEIERLGVEKNPFDVPLAGLQSIHDANKVSKLSYAKMDKAKGVVPYLTSRFIGEVNKFEKAYQGFYNVGYLLRSVHANERIGESRGNPHMTGDGMDVIGNDAEGIALKAWLKTNSSNGQINGTNLLYRTIVNPNTKEELIKIYMK